MIAEGLDDAHTSLCSATLNGKPLQRAYIEHGEIMAGGELKFTMQAQPNKDWATAKSQRPYSMSAE